jgi:hypothetical protein
MIRRFARDSKGATSKDATAVESTMISTVLIPLCLAILGLGIVMWAKAAACRSPRRWPRGAKPRVSTAHRMHQHRRNAELHGRPGTRLAVRRNGRHRQCHRGQRCPRMPRRRRKVPCRFDQQHLFRLGVAAAPARRYDHLRARRAIPRHRRDGPWPRPPAGYEHPARDRSPPDGP